MQRELKAEPMRLTLAEDVVWRRFKDGQREKKAEKDECRGQRKEEREKQLRGATVM